MSGFPPHERRVRHDIILEILRTAKNGAKKSHIMLKARLGPAQLKRYLNALKNAGFITDKSGIWQTTEKGLHIIDACEICCGLIEEGA